MESTFVGNNQCPLNLTKFIISFYIGLGTIKGQGISKFTIYLFAFNAFFTSQKLVRDKSIEISRIYIQISDGIVSQQGRFFEKGTRIVQLVTLPVFFTFICLHNPKKVKCETTDEIMNV